MVKSWERAGRLRPAEPARGPDRRHVVFGVAATLSALRTTWAVSASPAEERLIVTLNAALTETVIALGVQRLGAAALSSFQPPSGLPPIPAGAFDIGTMSEPNIELLIQERPAMFLHSPEWPPDPTVLRRLAPVIEVPIYVSGGDSYTNAGQALDRIASIIERPNAAARYRLHVGEAMEVTRALIAPYRNLRFLLMNSPGPRTMGSAGRGSLFDGVLRELGLRNAVTERGNYWGFRTVEMNQLLTMDDVWAIHIGPLPRNLKSNPFWQALPFIKTGRFVELPRIWEWGGLPSAVALATAMADAMRTIGHGVRG